MNLIGRQFGRWTVISVAPSRDSSGGLVYTCRCSCGVSRAVRGCKLTAGCSKSCGCLRKAMASERFTSHRMSRHQVYKAWAEMVARCHNASSSNFPNYGARGISVCPEWRNSFENFYECMGPRPEEGYSVEREDNDGNYEPGNCRWATKREQANNRRSNRLITAGGITKSIAEWARDLGIKPQTISARLRSGWSDEESILRLTKDFIHDHSK